MAKNNNKKQQQKQKNKKPSHATNSSAANNDQFPAGEFAYDLLSQVGGDGIRSAVFRAQCITLSNAVVAVKTIDLDKSRPDLPTHACSVAATLRHPSLLTPHRVFTAGRRLFVVMPFVRDGSLQSILHASFPNGLQQTRPIAALLKPVLAALSCIHAAGYAHGAISAANILIDSDGSVKLADYGFSAAVTASLPPRAAANADVPYWVAPPHEEESSCSQLKENDIWAFGVTALEVLWGEPPMIPGFKQSKSLGFRIFKRLHFADQDLDESTEHKHLSDGGVDEFTDMVRLCLDQDPGKRPSCELLLAHPFFDKCVDGAAKKLLGSRLPPLNQRYKVRMPYTEALIYDEDVKGRRRVVKWVLDEEHLLLAPVYNDDQASNSGKITMDGGGGYEELAKRVQDMRKKTDEHKTNLKDTIGLVEGLLKDETKREAELRAEVEKEREKTRAVEEELASLESEN